MNEQIFYLVVIAPREQKEKLVTKLHNIHANYCNIIYGHGSLDGSKLASLFPFAAEPRKIVITAFVRASDVDNIFNLLENELHFNQANTGFAFTVPIENIYH